MLSGLFTSVVDALISYAIDKLDPAETLKTWLKQDPARIAFQKALARAYSAFARQYPEYTSSLFDQSFLSTEALPELSKLLTRSQHPDPALLAKAWGQSISADADFAQLATKPASYFIERLEAELKAEPALQALFDSRALESLPKLEAEIQKLTSDLQRGLDDALKSASDYQKVTLHIEGDVKDSNIIIGDNNVINKYYYSGNFVSLNEYYIPPDGVFQRVRVDEFVGRDWLTAKVDAFLNDSKQKSGAFLLVGDAGVGKTAFMAHLVKERRYLHLFAEQVPGQAMLQRALQSLGSQLVTRYQIDPYKDRDTLNVLAGFPDFLERLLRLAASTLTEGEKIVIVCDALDEAGVFPDHFVFGLPKELPDGVYLILSQRPVNTKLPNFEPLRFDLEAQGEDNLQDMEDYLSAVAKRPVVAEQIRAKDYSEDFFIQTLKEKSLGVWMYLHYVIKEIERGQRAPLDLESLPKGLVGYYADYWDNWRSGRKGSDATKWDNLYVPLLATLATAQEAITVEKLIEWAGVQASPSEVTRLLSEAWGSFITEKEVKDKIVYTLYHQSLRDFITGKVEDIKKLPPTYASIVNDLSKKKVEAHQRIVNAFEKECNDEWEKLVEQDYPRLHLTAHLNGAKEYKKLIDLLTEGDEKIKWAEAREKKEETYAGYLSDLTYIWDYAEREQNYALAIRCMLIENSIHSLASNISPQLLAELAKAGLWGYARCLFIIRQKSVSYDQASSLEKIAPNLPPLLFQDALVAAREIEDETYRAHALAALAPYLNDELKTQALTATREIKDEYVRASTLAYLAPHLNDELKMQALANAHEMKSEFTRAHVASAFAPHLKNDLKTHLLQEALADTREIKDESSRALALYSLTPYLSDDLKRQTFQEALSAAHEIKDKTARALALCSLAPHLSDDLKRQTLQEALSTAHEIKEEINRARALADLVPYLTDELKIQTFREALTAAREIKDEFEYVGILSTLAPQLNDELRPLALIAAREIKAEFYRARALADLVPHLNDELKMQALAAIREVNHEYGRARALSDLLPYLSNELKAQVLQEALTVARKVKDESRTRALSALVPHLSDELKIQVIQESLAATREIRDEYVRANTLSSVALHLSGELKTQALQYALASAHKIENQYIRADAFSVLTLNLNGKLKKQALQEALSAARKIKTARILAALALHLKGNLKKQVLQEALVAALKVNDEFDHVDVSLTALAPQLNNELKMQALYAVYEIDDESARADALSSLVPYLNDELKMQVFDAACRIKSESARASALIDFAPHLNDELKMQALIAIREIKEEFTRARALSALAPHLSGRLKTQVFQEALVTAGEIENESRRVIALSDLTPYLNNELKMQVLQSALTAVCEIDDESFRDFALSNLVPRLNDELKMRALATVREIKNESRRARALTDFAPHLNDEIQITVFQELLYVSGRDTLNSALNMWKEIDFKGLKENIISFIEFVSQKDRKKGVDVVGALTPALVHFCGPEIAPELYRTIMDVTRWWP